VITPASTAFTDLQTIGARSRSAARARSQITARSAARSGATTKGEILINLPGRARRRDGKTITVHVAADPGCSQDLNLSMV
jgi:hypothetical protein